MIKSTIELKHYLKNHTDEKDYTIVSAYVKSILKLGSEEDAEGLLQNYIEDPFPFERTYLLSLFKKFGKASFAERIFNRVIVNDKLLDDVDPAVLELMGELKYEPIKKVLHDYAFATEAVNYYVQTSAVLGLLNFDCGEFTKEIEMHIHACLNKNIFPEFIPALVCKLPEREMILENLYESGDQHASTDCNAGILLGFSLCGEQGKKYFKKALYNPSWEVFSSATGTLKYAYEGMRNAGITFPETYADIRQITDDARLAYALDVLFSLFSVRVRDFENENIESFKTLYETFYRWESPNHANNLVTLAQKVERETEAFDYETLFEMKMIEEMIIASSSR